jgi:hypothetical protein
MAIPPESAAMNLHEVFLKYRTCRQLFKDCGAGGLA